jgi:hypothetical protein
MRPAMAKASAGKGDCVEITMSARFNVNSLLIMLANGTFTSFVHLSPSCTRAVNKDGTDLHRFVQWGGAFQCWNDAGRLQAGSRGRIGSVRRSLLST